MKSSPFTLADAIRLVVAALVIITIDLVIFVLTFWPLAHPAVGAISGQAG